MSASGLCATVGGMGRAHAKRYRCPETGRSFNSEIECAVFLLQGGTEANGTGELRDWLQAHEVTEVAGHIQSGSPSALTAKEQKAFDILVEAIHKARNGVADPGRLRTLQPLLPKGTLKRFVNRNSDTFQVVDAPGSNAGWGIAFADGFKATQNQRVTRSDICEDGDIRRLLTEFVQLFATQDHTNCHLLQEPLSKEQIVIASDQARQCNLFCHLLAHRLLLSKTKISAAQINCQAAFAGFLFDEKMTNENEQLQSFLADDHETTLVFSSASNKTFRYCQDLSLAGCGFSVIKLPDGRVKCLKFAARDSSGVLLDDFFANKVVDAPRIVQLQQQHVSTQVRLPDRLLKKLKSALASAGHQDIDSQVQCPGALRPDLPGPDCEYPVNTVKRQELHKLRETLPAWAHQEQVVEAFKSHRVMVLSGATGSGKTTQVPQFILDYGELPPYAPLVICTQPRRIAAISVAERVAAERGQPVGHEVGYHVRFENSYRGSTRLLFMTPGVLLRKLQDDAALPGVGCIILDEVHERDVSTDFILLIAKKLLIGGSTHAKIVLMSATLHAEQLVKYFADVKPDVDEECPDVTSAQIPVIHVEGRTHPVQEFYLEDALKWTGLEFETNTLRLVQAGDAYTCFDECVQEQLDSLTCRLEATAWEGVVAALPKLRDTFACESSPGLEIHELLNVSPLEALSGQKLLVDVRLISRLGPSSWQQLDVAVELFNNEALSMKLLQELTVDELEPPKFDEPTLTHSETADTQANMASGDDALLNKWRAVPKVQPELVTAVLEFFHTSALEGAVLVFLPGMADILAVERALESSDSCSNWWIAKCHSGLPSHEQQLAFRRPPPGHRKVVLATNIAESSITLSDVIFVIDTGLRKENSFSFQFSADILSTVAVSQTNAIQRRGRAGRVRPGVCVHLFPRAAFEQLQPYPQPEILRAPLEELCLQIFCLGVSDVQSFLQEAMDPPDMRAIGNALDALQQLHCIDFDSGVPKATVIGHQLANLPLHPLLGRLLLVGALLGCLTPAAIVAASLSLKTPFLLPIDGAGHKRLSETRASMASMSPTDVKSDQLILLHVYEAWAAEGKVQAKQQLCNELGLSHASLTAIHSAKEQLMRRTMSLFKPAHRNKVNSFVDRRASDHHLLVAVAAAALYPNCAIPKVGQSESGGGKRQQWLTRDGFTAMPHQESVLKSFRSRGAADNAQGLQSSDFLVFFERSTAQSGLQLGDCSLVPALPFLLTAGQAVAQEGCLELDSWLTVQTPQAHTLLELSNMFNSYMFALCAPAKSCFLSNPRVTFLDIVADLLAAAARVEHGPNLDSEEMLSSQDAPSAQSTSSGAPRRWQNRSWQHQQGEQWQQWEQWPWWQLWQADLEWHEHDDQPPARRRRLR